MKKCVFIAALILGLGWSTTTMAQKNSSNQEGNNEFKINMGYVLLEFPELTYERIINEESATGVSVNFALDRNINFNYGVIPYYRFYFGEKRAAGFFIEGNSVFFRRILKPVL